jgi:GTP-binding protein
MSYLIAIVGRPNVGKSTLFNRIVGGREAIVDDMPGVTRDRNYSSAEWLDKTFTLVDTGGFVPTSKDLIETSVREQAEIAIAEADAVIFVVDAMADVHPLDEELATILRKSQKKVYLVVNKVDGENQVALAGRFYGMGFGDPFLISALGGRNIGDFLDKVTEPIVPELEEPPLNGRLKLAIVGKPNVGKSSLVNALLNKQRTIVSDVPGTTRDSINATMLYEEEEITLIDTAGLRRKSRIKESIEFYSTLRTLKSIDECNVAVLMIDMMAGIDKQDLRILQRIAEQRRGIVLAVNKWDAFEKDGVLSSHYEKYIRSFLRMYDYVPVIFVSAIRRVRIFKLIDIAREIFKEQQKKVPTSKLNDMIQKDFGSHPPSNSTGKEIKLNYITQIERGTPVFAFFLNDPRGIDEQYKRFLEKKLREHFGFHGVPLTLQFRRKN